MKKGDIIEDLVVETMAAEGKCESRINGLVIFLEDPIVQPRSYPGDSPVYDAVVIGSGYGGAIPAARLAAAGSVTEWNLRRSRGVKAMNSVGEPADTSYIAGSSLKSG